MKMFMLKVMFLAAIMFASVLFGMQQANEGIQNMRGFDDPNFKGAMTIKETEGGELQASILGSDVSSHDLEQKKQKLEEMKAYNFFSSLGKQFAEGVQNATEKALQFITDFIKGV